MASNFYMPDWAFAPPSPPEPPPLPTATDLNIPVEAYAASTSYAMDPSLELGPELWDEVDRANATRVDELSNEFIDRQGEILHDGDDAFFKQTGRDAILNAPAIHARLEAARQETLGRAANDVQREWLGETLGKHKIVEHFDIGGHVGRQSLIWQKSINRRRLDLLTRQAGIDHADTRMIHALANSSESSARDHARASGYRPDSPEAQAEVDIARSSVFRHAIEGALAKGAHAVAIKLHERAKDKLVPGDAKLLDRIIEDARESAIGRDYVARIAPPSAMANRSVADLDKAQAEAITRNNEDWKDNASQRTTNQHYINVQFGKAKRQVEMEKAKLARTVHDWLTSPGPDGRLRIERPPIPTWVRLTPEEQKGVDSVLKMNARGGKSAEELVRGSYIFLAQATLPQMQAEEEKKKRIEEQKKKELEMQLEPDGTRNRLRIKRIDDRKNPRKLDIQWELDRPSATGGFIVQKIEGVARKGKPYIYWEAWPVRRGSKTPPRATESDRDDTFRFHKDALPHVKEGLGRRTIGTARFYEGMTEAELRGKGFTIGGADGAGTDQLSIPMQDPDLPTGNATPGVIREWMPPF